MQLKGYMWKGSKVPSRLLASNSDHQCRIWLRNESFVKRSQTTQTEHIFIHQVVNRNEIQKTGSLNKFCSDWHIQINLIKTASHRKCYFFPDYHTFYSWYLMTLYNIKHHFPFFWNKIYIILVLIRQLKYTYMRYKLSFFLFL